MTTRGYVTLPDGQVHYRERAGSAPPVVFLHQTALSSRCYEALMGASQLPNRLLAFDLPGFGESFRPDGWPDMGRYGEWIFQALDGLGVREAYFFGHHTGAALAVEMAYRHPGRVRGVMLCGLGLFTLEEGAQFRGSLEAPLAPVPDGSHLLENWHYTAEHNAGVAPDVIHDQVVDMLQAWRARPQAYVAVAEHDVQRAFKGLTVPVLLVTSPGDYFEDHVARGLALRPGTEVVSIGGGNLAPELDPGGTAKVVAAFVGRSA